MALRVPFNPTLDGGLVDIDDGSTSKRAIRIEAGEYATPFWIRTDSGIVLPVAELPWQGVLEAGQMEVLSAAPGAAFNEPAGFTQLVDDPWTSIGSPWTAFNASASGSTTIVDGKLQWFYPTGFGGGFTPGDKIIAESNAHGPVAYQREEGFIVSANWQGHGSNVNKVRFWTAPDNTTDGYLYLHGGDAGMLHPMINTQGWPVFATTPLMFWNQADNQASPTEAQATFARGVEHTLETLVEKGTAGNADGRVRLWLNDVLILDYPNVALTPSGEAAHFGGLHYAPVWGGTGDTVDADMTLSIGRTYVSYGSL